ncbi:hypothetical protein Scep_001784 [Stephania cephalantha]|uniref:Uncharacterized protein n=1 Tax=Stephania cephalantha TaxID=152367 RepID=A0AAP0LA06_9MAGN
MHSRTISKTPRRYPTYYRCGQTKHMLKRCPQPHDYQQPTMQPHAGHGAHVETERDLEMTYDPGEESEGDKFFLESGLLEIRFQSYLKHRLVRLVTESNADKCPFKTYSNYYSAENESFEIGRKLSY